MQVAVVGPGRMGEAHAKAWGAAGVEVAAVVDRSAARPLLDAPSARVTADLASVLDDPAIGIVSICTPTDTHLELTTRALDAGKHVLLEKPMTRTEEEGEALVERARRGPGLLMVAHVVRFFPGYVAVRELVEGGVVGTPQEVEAERLSATGGRPAWVDDEARSGGPVLDLAVHDFDQLVALLGAPVRVRASMGDHGVVEAVTEHVGGGTGRLRAGWDLPAGFPFTTRLQVTGADGRVDFRAVGPEARLEVDAAGDHRTERIPPGDPYGDQARYFLECIRSGMRPEHGDPGASLAALRLALGARTALATGAAVDLTRPDPTAG